MGAGMLTTVLCCFAWVIAGAWQGGAQAGAAPVPLFDGRTFQGWEGDTQKTWRIENGALVGGSLTETVPNNDFLTTTRRYSNFVLRLKFKLTGSDGFINGGVQFRSERMRDPAHEMIGYQADLGAKVLGQPLRRVAPQQGPRRARSDEGRAAREARRLE